MNASLPADMLNQIEREQQHFTHAPEAFFQSWKRGVKIAGHQWFGDGTRENLTAAASIWDLRPRMANLQRPRQRTFAQTLRF